MLITHTQTTTHGYLGHHTTVLHPTTQGRHFPSPPAHRQHKQHTGQAAQSGCRAKILPLAQGLQKDAPWPLTALKDKAPRNRNTDFRQEEFQTFTCVPKLSNHWHSQLEVISGSGVIQGDTEVSECSPHSSLGSALLIQK